MATNNFEIILNASVEKVWSALTNTNEFNTWMKNVKVQTDWNQGSEITYTCYDENGNVMKWNDIEMIWNGRIKTIEMCKEMTCIYPDKSTGLIDESFYLEMLSEDSTKLIQVQTLISQEVADGYNEGVNHTLVMLKNYLENTQ
jgi:uncharacterized protein YndB with AHSA1/START domain